MFLPVKALKVEKKKYFILRNKFSVEISQSQNLDLQEPP